MPDPIRLKSKICLVGGKAVGKTALARRYVLNMYDDHYITTIGTKVSKKEMHVVLPDEVPVDVGMTIWDITGEDRIRDILKEAYFRGVQGILAVADLTRLESFEELSDWIGAVDDVAGRVPVVLAANKADLASKGSFETGDATRVAGAGTTDRLSTSAKTGEHLEEAFQRLAVRIATQQIASR